MNIISPFGRLSRKGYLVVAVPLFVAGAALDWLSFTFGPADPQGPPDLPESPWARWMLLAGPLGCLLTWCLFCACVKRHHDFRWSGFAALIVLWPWVIAVAPILVELAIAHGYLSVDTPDPFTILDPIAAGIRIISWALMLILAVIPGRKHPGEHDEPATVEVF